MNRGGCPTHFVERGLASSLATQLNGALIQSFELGADYYSEVRYT